MLIEIALLSKHTERDQNPYRNPFEIEAYYLFFKSQSLGRAEVTCTTSSSLSSLSKDYIPSNALPDHRRTSSEINVLDNLHICYDL